MTTTGLSSFDATIEKTNAFLNDVTQHLGGDRQQAHQATRAVLHALRDRLAVDETAHLGSQLPALLRGVYYEGWRPATDPSKERSREEFLSRVRRELPDGASVEPEAACKSVFAALEGQVTAGEIGDVKHCLPEPIRELWPPG